MSKYKIDYNGWSDDASPIKPDVKIKSSHARLVGFTLISESKKGKKHSEEHKKKIGEKSKNRKLSNDTKNKISKALSNKSKSNEHIQKLKKTKLQYKITKKQILDIQKECNTAKEVANKLGIDFNTYKRIAEIHGVYKMLSLSERNKLNADIVDVWEYNPSKKDNRGKYIGRITKPEARKKYNIHNMNKFFDGTYKQVNGYVLKEINNLDICK
jgi:hypothetical protein